MTGVTGPDDYRRLYGDARAVRAAPMIGRGAFKMEGKAGLVSTISNLSLTDPRLYSRAGDDAGVAVTAGSAMSYSTFFACTRLLAQVVASCPIQVLEDTARGKVEARQYPLWAVLHDSPNADQTPTDYVEELTLGLVLAGDHIARTFRAGSGRVISVEPVNPFAVDVYRRADRSKGYRWHDDDGSHDLGEADVLHIPGFGAGKLRGLSILGYARQTLGLAHANDSQARSVMRNGLRPSAVLSFEKFLTEDQRALARNQLMDDYAGAMNAGRPFIAEGGVKLESFSMTAEDAQLLESRAFAIEEICRFFGMPPFMIGHTEKTTSWGTGLTEQVNAFHKFTLGPMLRKIQQRLTKHLIPAAERTRFSVEFNVEGLLAADPNGRVEFYKGLGQLRAITVNEIRRKENMPPVAWGDEPVTLASNVSANEGLNP